MSQPPTVLVPGHHPRARAFVDALEARGFAVALVEGDLSAALPRAAAYVALVDATLDGPEFARNIIGPARAAKCRVFCVLDSPHQTLRDRLLIAGAADVSPQGDPDDLATRVEAALLGWMRTGPSRRLKASFKAQRGRETFDLPVSAIDPSGLSLASGDGLKRGELLRVALPLPNGRQLAWGRVVDDQGRPAFRFLGLSLEERRRIAAAIQKKTPSTSTGSPSPESPPTQPPPSALKPASSSAESPTPNPTPAETLKRPPESTSTPLGSPTSGTASSPDPTPFLPEQASGGAMNPVAALGATSSTAAKAVSSSPPQFSQSIEDLESAEPPNAESETTEPSASHSDVLEASTSPDDEALISVDLPDITEIDLTDIELTNPSLRPMDPNGVAGSMLADADGVANTNTNADLEPVLAPELPADLGSDVAENDESGSQGDELPAEDPDELPAEDLDPDGGSAASADVESAETLNTVDSIADAIGELLGDVGEDDDEDDATDSTVLDSDDVGDEAVEELPLQRWPERVPTAEELDADLQLAVSQGMVSADSGELGQTILEFAGELIPMERRAWDEKAPEELLAPELVQRQLNLRLRLYLLSLEARSQKLPPAARWEIDEELLRPLKVEANELLDDVQQLADEFIASGEAKRIKELHALRAPISRALGELESATNQLLGIEHDPSLGKLPLDHEERVPGEEEAPPRRRQTGKKGKKARLKVPSARKDVWKRREANSALIRRMVIWSLVLVGLVAVLIMSQPERARRVSPGVVGDVNGVVDVVRVDDKATVRMAPAWQVDPAAIDAIRLNLARAGVESAVIVDFDGRLIAVGRTRSALRLMD